jgi:hypothetical protein
MFEYNGDYYTQD